MKQYRGLLASIGTFVVCTLVFGVISDWKFSGDEFRRLFSEWALVASTAGLMIATVGLVLATVQLARSADDGHRRTTRAYLYASIGELDKAISTAKDGVPRSVEFDITNAGQTPAFNIEISLLVSGKVQRHSSIECVSQFIPEIPVGKGLRVKFSLDDAQLELLRKSAGLGSSEVAVLEGLMKHDNVFDEHVENHFFREFCPRETGNYQGLRHAKK